MSKDNDNGGQIGCGITARDILQLSQESNREPWEIGEGCRRKEAPAERRGKYRFRLNRKTGLLEW